MPDECTHLGQIREVTPGAEGCEECLQSGDEWVHLRMCLVCGHIGCCDESKNRHATAHFHETTHPVMCSFEPDEDWVWCYEDRIVMFPERSAPQGYDTVATPEFLRRLPLFADLSEDDLTRIYGMARPAQLAEGQMLMREGEMGDAVYVVLEGEFEVTKQSAQGEVVLSRRVPGDVVGEMSLIIKAPRSASVRALSDSRVLVISQNAFEQLLACSPAAGLSVLRTMAARLESTQALLAQQEKLAGLGRLSAGLAHELNNPAAAIHRSSDQLRDVFARWQRLAVQLDTLTFTQEQADELNVLRGDMEARSSKPLLLDPLARSDRESDLQEWLEERGVEEAWEVSPVLVSFGWDVEGLENLTAPFSDEQLPVIVPWLATGCSAYSLLNEVSTSASHISQIVKAVKTYSYLDQAPVQQIDVHEGLENTLIILKHKLKAGVTVKRDYAPDLPRIEAYASELNQVWTNLIDNAIDAMEGRGEIVVHTYSTHSKGRDAVVVEITDNGPGMPEDVQARIFQPFFTTKPVGVGTGLGLHIAYNIIVDKHHGQISVTSKPGETRFSVTLPVELARE
ncbi:MAG TPA: ATP-binding protein [Chloroflexia bacterium]|nr:ATP-binding protein [Chloroflexia bacterium]